MKTVVVTGGTRGIGLGLVRSFLDRGCSVAFCGRSQSSVDKALAELGAGERAIGVVADVTDEDTLQGLWNAAVAAYGRVDVWINNAGVSAPRKPLDAVPLDDVQSVVGINLLGAIHGSRVALRGFLAQGGGQLWNMEGFGSSGMTAPGIVTYGSTKRAVTYLQRSLAKETKGLPVQVGLLSPGIVLTDLLVQDYDGDPAALEKAKKIFNILGDRVETVTPWLADRVLATRKTGAHVQWLTRGKAARRFATASFRKRDLVGARVTLAADFEPSVALALWDFVPVVLAGLGLVLLSRHIGQERPSWGRTAFRGAVLVTLGGLAKAGWKLEYALTGDDIGWLDEALFMLLAPGFAFVAASLSPPRTARWWLGAIPPVFAVGAVWPVTFMVLAIAGATATAVLCLLRARRRGDRLTATLFGAQLALAFALVPLAAPPQTAGKQWAEETINAVAQGLFALAAWRLFRSDPSETPTTRVREEVPA